MRNLFRIGLLIFVILCASCLPISAMDPDRTAGTVLYHQDFAEVSLFENSGLRLGTSSSAASEVSCEGGALSIQTKDSGRVYTILPSVQKTNSYTLEFTFRFAKIAKENGYLAAILTCRGEEPTNITEVVIRADGCVDDFEEPPEKLKAAIAGGKTVGVTIPIEGGVLHEITLTADGIDYPLERASVQVITGGELGFAVRNVCAELPEVWLVNGTDYTEKKGVCVRESYASDDEVIVVPEDEAEQTAPEESPSTGTFRRTAALWALTLASGVLTVKLRGRKDSLV